MAKAKAVKRPSISPKISTRPSGSVLSPSTIITSYAPKRRVQLQFPDGSGRTKQSFKAECDINNIMARFQRTGVFDFVNKHGAQYGDVTGVDFQTAMDQVKHAKAMFGDLPASIRASFGNDPGAFLEFAQDPKNLPAMVEMGLATPRAVAAPVPATPPAAAPAVLSEGAVAVPGGGSPGEPAKA